MIIIKTDQEIETIREGGKLLAKILKQVLKQVKVGATTGELEELACALIAKTGGKPAFKGYKNGGPAYPTALCISLNDEVVHAPALPPRLIQSGDIVSIDVGMEYKSLFTDMAATVAVGKVDKNVIRLLEATKKSLALGIAKVKPGNSIYDIGKAVEDYIIAQGFSVVKDLVGHGVGKAVHEDPQIPNFAIPEYKGILLRPGMVIAIEPMVNMGKYQVYNAKDGHTIKTSDGSLSAHFEHTVAVTKTGYKILTV